MPVVFMAQYKQNILLLYIERLDTCYVPFLTLLCLAILTLNIVVVDLLADGSAKKLFLPGHNWGTVISNGA